MIHDKVRSIVVRAPFSILCALTLAAAGCGRDFPYRIETSERRTDGRVAGTDPADAEISDRLDPIQDVPSPGDGFIPDRDPSMDGDLPDLVIPDAGPMDGFIADRVTFDARPPMPDTGSSDSGLPDGPIIPDVFVPDAFIPDTGITMFALPAARHFSTPATNSTAVPAGRASTRP